MSSCTTHTYVNDIVPSVAPSQPSITSSGTLPNGVQGSAYSFTFQATGGVEPYSWSLSSFVAPVGMTFSGATGELFGTPEDYGTYSYTASLTDAVGNEATLAVTWTVLDDTPLTINTNSTLPDGTQNEAYSFTLAASGGTEPYAWTLTSGSLPTGLTLSSGGVISGTPTGTGESTFTVTLTDDRGDTDSQALSLTIGASAPTLAISTESPLPEATVGAYYQTDINATGGTGTLSWSISAGAIPGGMSFNPLSGTLFGTPTVGGLFNFTVDVQDEAAATDSKAFAITVSGSVVTLEITTTVLPAGRVGSAYSQALSLAGGTAPYTWSISSGSLPAGLSLSTGGVISGTPTTAGNSSFTVQVEDANADTDTQGLTIEVLTEPDNDNLYPNAPTGAGWTDITPGGGGWETSPVGSWTVEFDTRDGWGLKSPNSSRTQSIEVVSETPIGEARTARFTYPDNHFAGGGGEFFIEGGSRFFGTRKIYVGTWMRLSSNWWGHGSCVNKLYYVRPRTGGQWWIQFCASGNGTLTPRFTDQITSPPVENFVATTSPTTYPRRGEFFLIESIVDLDAGTAKLWTKRTDQAAPVLHVDLGPADWDYQELAGTRWDSVVLSGILGGKADTNNPEIQFMEYDNVKVMVSP